MAPEPASRTERVTVRGLELAYECAGAGPPVLWAHGMTSSRAAEARRGLLDVTSAAAQRRVIRYDARGHGASGWTAEPADATWENLGRDMIALADALDLDRFAAGGASMGCATTLFAALQAPERIDRLVLVIPPTAWETRAERAHLYNAAAALVEASGVAALADLEAQEPLPEIFARDFPEKREHDYAATMAMHAEALAAALRGAGLSDLPPRDQVRRLTHPALILAWATDPVHPASTAEALADLLPDAALSIAASLADIRAWPARVRDFLAAPNFPVRLPDAKHPQEGG